MPFNFILNNVFFYGVQKNKEFDDKTLSFPIVVWDSKFLNKLYELKKITQDHLLERNDLPRKFREVRRKDLKNILSCLFEKTDKTPCLYAKVRVNKKCRLIQRMFFARRQMEIFKLEDIINMRCNGAVALKFSSVNIGNVISIQCEPLESDMMPERKGKMFEAKIDEDIFNSFELKN